MTAATPTRSALPRFLGLYAALFGAFGVASPFIPALMQERGLAPGAIGTALGAGTAIRLLAGPFGGRLADRLGRRRLVLGLFAAAAAAIALCYGPAHGFAAVLAVSVLHASVLAPLTPVADALVLDAAGAVPGTGVAPGGGAAPLRYGVVRGAGSAAFVLAANVAGRLVGRFGLDVVVRLNASLLAVASLAAFAAPDRDDARPPDRRAARGGVRALLRLPSFVPLMAVASLVMGSAAMHDGFAVIRWRAAGIAPATASLLFSEQVVAEVLVFVFLGDRWLRRSGVRGACTLAAAAGVVRWTATALTTSPALLALSEPLHGLTFALLHLACMRRIAAVVPARLLATAQAFYATVATGFATAVLSLASGVLYGRFGGHAFLAMAALCAVAVPLARGLPDAPGPGRG